MSLMAFFEPEAGRFPETDANGLRGRDVGNEGAFDDVRASGALEGDMPARGEDMDGRLKPGFNGEDMQFMDMVDMVSVNRKIRSWSSDEGRKTTNRVLYRQVMQSRGQGSCSGTATG